MALGPCRWRGVHRGRLLGARLHAAARRRHHQQHLHRARHPPGERPLVRAGTRCCTAMAHDASKKKKKKKKSKHSSVVTPVAWTCALSCVPRAALTRLLTSAPPAGAHGDDEHHGHQPGRAGAAALGGHQPHRHPLRAQPLQVSWAAAGWARGGWVGRGKEGPAGGPGRASALGDMLVLGDEAAPCSHCHLPRVLRQEAAVPPGARAASAAAHVAGRPPHPD